MSHVGVQHMRNENNNPTGSVLLLNMHTSVTVEFRSPTKTSYNKMNNQKTNTKKLVA